MSDIQGKGRPDRLSIEHATDAGMRIVTLRGEIDHDSTEALSEALLSWGDDEVPRIAVDLGGVTFLDSSGINVFIQVNRTVAAAHGWLHLAAAHGPVMRVIQLVGLDAVIPCYETLQQALTSDLQCPPR